MLIMTLNINERIQFLLSDEFFNLMTERRFWEKVEIGKDDECWNWAGSTRNGYGQFLRNGKLEQAHRMAWIFSRGKELSSSDVHVHRNCQNLLCVNPHHLFLA